MSTLYNNKFSGIANKGLYQWSSVRRISFLILGVKGLNDTVKILNSQLSCRSKSQVMEFLRVRTTTLSDRLKLYHDFINALVIGGAKFAGREILKTDRCVKMLYYRQRMQRRSEGGPGVPVTLL